MKIIVCYCLLSNRRRKKEEREDRREKLRRQANQPYPPVPAPVPVVMGTNYYGPQADIASHMGYTPGAGMGVMGRTPPGTLNQYKHTYGGAGSQYGEMSPYVYHDDATGFDATPKPNNDPFSAYGNYNGGGGRGMYGGNIMNQGNGSIYSPRGRYN